MDNPRKITSLKEVRLRTIYVRDQYNNKVRDAEEWIFDRPVNTVSTGRRFGHFMIDTLIFQLVWNIFLRPVVDDNAGSMLLTLFSLFFIYYGLTEFLFQKTPGKFITKTVVADTYAEKPAFGTDVTDVDQVRAFRNRFQAQNKATENDASVIDFVNSVADEKKRSDSFRLSNCTASKPGPNPKCGNRPLSVLAVIIKYQPQKRHQILKPAR